MASYDIPQETLGRQHSASNPDQSVWVSANAGSGKTHVLASRVIRLLLQGVAPSKLLCLTFTKAAAANMASGVFDKLAKWTQLADGDLSAEIIKVGAPEPASGDLRAARKLFARTLETPGGLKIQTIHAFCERLLHLFPFEANVPARFEVLDEQGQAEVLQRARRAVLTEAMSGKGVLGAALERLSDECGPDGFDDLIKEAMRQSAISQTRWPQDPAEILRRTLDLAEGRDCLCIEREMVEGGITPESWQSIAAILEQGSANDRKMGKLFLQAESACRSRPSEYELRECLESYLAIFFTEQGKGTPRDSVVTKAINLRHPQLAAELFAEQGRLDALREERKAAATLERTRALIEIAAAIFKRYGEEKAARGLLDFEDLIGKTLALLERSEARWVLYKLDSGIDHVLVDEAQDTSEAQWKILEELTGDFAAGEGQSRAPRTFFAVGDEKQSIFSFQGAAPRMFDEMRRTFGKRFTDGGQSFLSVPLNASFRSAPGVLAAIDKVFEHGEHKSGVVAAGDVWRPHQALKHELPALLEFWPLVTPRANEHPREWTLPLDLLDEQDPANLVAQRIAQKIAQLLAPGSGESVHERGTLERRPVRAGDILILVRTRGPFFEAMIRALKKNHIQTAGADRLELAQHIAVMDLIAAGRASLLPQDDLTLACVLKSPLIGLDDDDLIALAPGRTASLFDALQASADPRHAAAAKKLAVWRARAGGGPFAFYAALLGAGGGRRDMEARLGQEAGDAIDEFLNLAIKYEGSAAASLAAFLNDLAGLEYSIKRDMETGGDAVRVMTVHAAKGLEAKIVFLPDTCAIPSPRHDPKIFKLGTDVPGEETIAWSPGKNHDCELIARARAGAREETMEEYRRLLYVALTRAEERLYIAGFHGERKQADGCWAGMIAAAFAEEAGVERVPAFWNGKEDILRFTFNQSGAFAAVRPGGETSPAPVVRPDWLGRAARDEANAPLPVSPSNVFAPASQDGAPAMTQTRRDALRRGRLVHLLLQSLPGIAPLYRRDAALTFLAARGAFLDDTARQDLADEVLKVIDAPDLAGLFGPRSKAEVQVSGRITIGPREIDVAGQVDRVGEDALGILIADYKTGTPCGQDDIPAGYLTQLALYRAVLAPLWPNRPVRAMLIWTQGPLLVPVSAVRLDAALAAYAG
ncbi:MAG TPA: double-strand break repair helicase AddA [Methylocella sp.]